MTIKEIAARTGVSADTLRYYERMGIIPAVPRTSGGVRNYDENFVEWVAFIQTLKGAGMSLEAIADYINLAKLGEQTCQQRKKILDYQLMSYDTVLRPRTDSLVGAFTSA